MTTIAASDMASVCHTGPFATPVCFIAYHYFLCPLFGLIFAFMFKGLYNVFFHELHHVPGPFLGGFTDFYKVYIFACRHIPSGTMELHQRFGEPPICP